MIRDTAAFQHFASTATSASNADVVTFPRSAGRVTLTRRSADEWSTVLGERFNKLTSLPKGWDGYSGRPVSFTCASFAVQILERLYDPEVPPPSLVPGSDGTLQIEWHTNDYDLEIDVLAPFSLNAMRFDCLTQQYEEVEIQADASILARWVAELKVDRSNKQLIEAA